MESDTLQSVAMPLLLACCEATAPSSLWVLMHHIALYSGYFGSVVPKVDIKPVALPCLAHAISGLCHPDFMLWDD